jgi:hypothetical protein
VILIAPAIAEALVMKMSASKITTRIQRIYGETLNRLVSALIVRSRIFFK